MTIDSQRNGNRRNAINDIKSVGQQHPSGLESNKNNNFVTDIKIEMQTIIGIGDFLALRPSAFAFKKESGRIAEVKRASKPTRKKLKKILKKVSISVGVVDILTFTFIILYTYIYASIHK